MPHVTRPDDFIEAFAENYNAGRLEDLVELFEPDAVAVDENGVEYRGHDRLRLNLAGLLALDGTMTFTKRYTLVQGEIALLSADWGIETQNSDGAPPTVSASGRSAEAVRRQADGRWLYIFDHPFQDLRPEIA